MWMVPLVLLIGLITGSAWQQGHWMEEIAEFSGLLIAFFAMIGRAWTYLFMENTPSHLPVIQGPFRHMAYPLHFFASLAMGGLGLMMGSYTIGLLLFLAGFVMSRILINHNEKVLRREVSDEQSLYQNIVPNFFPSLRARITADGQVDRPIYTSQTIRLIAIDLAIFCALIVAADLFDGLHENGTLSQFFLLY